MSKALYYYSIGFFCLLFLAGIFFYGVAVGKYQIPPFNMIKKAQDAVEDVFVHWENDANINPTRHLVPRRSGNTRIVTHDNKRKAQGLRLVAAFTGKDKAHHGAYLIDENDNVTHYWPVYYDKLDPEGRAPTNVFLHGFNVFPDGSIIVNFDFGNVLARIDACGNTIWRNLGWYHHNVSKGLNGTVWSWKRMQPEDAPENNGQEKNVDEHLVEIKVDSGEVVTEISFIEDIMLPYGVHGVFAIRKADEDSGFDGRYLPDPFHPNDIEILTEDLATKFPNFKTGDILISLRSLNTVAVLDGKSYKPVWWHTGPWHRQHDPDFLSNGTISVFNNNMQMGKSTIDQINPATNQVVSVFSGTDEQPFYTWVRGKHEYLPNGNILITESQAGRVIEVSGDEIVWEYQNIYDEKNNAVTNKAMLLPSDFFNPGALTCK